MELIGLLASNELR